MIRNQVYILSDAIRVGKTTTLRDWAKRIDGVVGFLSPDIEGKRMFKCIETGELIPMESEEGDLEIGKFKFESNSFRLVEKKIIEKWLEATSDFIVVDEIGPLEIRKNLGFHDLLLKLQLDVSKDKPNILFVVRDNCLDMFLDKYKFKNVQVMDSNQFKRKFLF